MAGVLARNKLRLLIAQSVSTVETVATSPHPISEVHAFQMGNAGSSSSYVILRVRTQSGLIGYGECNSLSPSEL
jgi:L-alanine-DL-glutamate epimerase-like enolase superfamily enzyme